MLLSMHRVLGPLIDHFFVFYLHSVDFDQFFVQPISILDLSNFKKKYLLI